MFKKKSNLITTFLPYLLLAVPLLFNAITLAPELSIKNDPNDNIFHFALTYRTNEVINNIFIGKDSLISIVDHWDPYWASGYPLSYYYQHLPQLTVITVYYLLLKSLSLYQAFNLVKYLLWVFFPLSIYFSSRLLGFKKLTSALTALFASQMLTDGLYGMDISSFAWRGYGITTQLYALFFAPLALGQIYDSLKNNRRYWLAVLLLSVTFACHLAIGYLIGIAGLVIPLALINYSVFEPSTSRSKIKNQKSKTNELGFYKWRNWDLFRSIRIIRLIRNLFKNYLRLFLIFAATFLLLSYWLVPLLLNSAYHSISFWDPPVKWNSYGAPEIIKMFLNGQLFDYQRIPILTILVVIGFLVCLYRFKSRYRLLAILWPLFLLLYFGRTTWGNLIDLLPQMKEMHQQRLVNGLQMASVFVIGIGANWLIKTLINAFERLLKLISGKQKVVSKKYESEDLSPITYYLSLITVIIVLAFPVYRANWLWLKANSDWLNTANQQYTVDEPDFNRLVDKLNTLPKGRVYAGRPGNWGRQFQIGATQIYLALSTRGFWLNGFLPESWSLNSEVETFFNDQNYNDFQLYNVRYIVAPKEITFPEYAHLVDSFGKFYLYSVQTTGFFDLGTSNLLVESGKENITNIHHLWAASNLPSQKEFPSLLITGKPENLNYTAKIQLLGTNAYERDEQVQSLFNLSFNLKPEPKSLGTVKENLVEAEHYSATVDVDPACDECLVIFKSTYHPNWRVTIDDQRVRPFMVFPSFMAVKVSPGQHQVEFKYQPAGIKLPLIIIGVGSFTLLTVKRKKVAEKLI